MKRTVIFFMLACISTTTYSQNLNTIITTKNGKKQLEGQVDKNGLLTSPFNDWFTTQYELYLTNDKVVRQLKDSLKQYTIKVFFGSWCGDSKRELPRFYRILDAINFPEKQLQVIAVNNATETYKQAPNHEEKGLNIHRVPTFIFYKNDIEVNRIVEYPVETLERDILKIISKKRYNPNYRAVSYINHILKKESIDSLKLKESELILKLADYVKGSRELNTYGYVLLRAADIDKALYVFNLNTKLFPYKANVFNSLAEAYYDIKDYDNALKNYYKALSLNPKHEQAKMMIANIDAVLKQKKLNLN